MSDCKSLTIWRPQLDNIYCMDALALMRQMEPGSVSLIATDPPYFRVKDDWWDNQWDTDGAFIAWIGELCREFRRVLKPNGSLYLFASPQMSARVEVEVGKWFRVLNRITWRKPAFSTKAEMVDKDMMRAYFPASESIIFAEQFGSDATYDGALIDENATYWDACQSVKATLIGDYLSDEFVRAKVTRREIAELFPSKTGGLTGCVSNWILGHNIPTPEQYQAMRDYLNSRNGVSDYLRREYEDLRRPFNSTPDAPYTDVWDFATVQAYSGKHPAEKPLDLMQHIVRLSSRPSDLVLDPFAGSGTTLDAARRLGRHYIGGDLDARWAAYARDRATRPYAQPLPLFCEPERDHDAAPKFTQPDLF